MALPFGPVLLLAVVVGAAAAGLDMRKKKKKNGATNGANGGGAIYDVVPCAHVLDMSADGEQASLDGGAWQSSEALDDFPIWAVEFQRPQILFSFCQSDPQLLQILNQLCSQRDDADFYGVYVDRLTGPMREAAIDLCVEKGIAVRFQVVTPVSDTVVREYKLMYHPGDNISQAIATLVAFMAGVDHPDMEEVEVV